MDRHAKQPKVSKGQGPNISVKHGSYLRKSATECRYDMLWVLSTSYRYSLHCALAAAQCIVIGPVCLCVCGGLLPR